MKTSRTISWILLLAVVGGVGYYGWQRYHGAEEAKRAEAQKAARPPAVRVTTAPVEKTDFPVYLTGLGTVQGFNTVQVRTRVDGQIDKIAFKEGQIVNQGDLLVEIDPRPFQATLDQAKAKKAQDEANLANANLDLQRYTKLGEFATKQQTDTQRSTVAQLTAQIAADDAAIANAQTQLDYTQVKAPISGVAGLRQVDIGNIVNASSQTGIVSIAQIEPIAVIFTAPEEQLPYINEGQKAGAVEGDRDHHRRQEAAGRRQARSGQQPGRHHQRDYSAEGGVRQQGSRAVARPIGVDTAFGEDLEGRYGGAGRCHPALDQRPLCLHREPGQQGRVAQGEGQLVDRRTSLWSKTGLSPGQQVITGGQFKVQPGTLVTTAVASQEPAQAKVRQE